MKEIKITPKFSIGEHVYLNIEGGEARLIVDVIFNLSSKLIAYQVMDPQGVMGTYLANELTKERVVI